MKKILLFSLVTGLLNARYTKVNLASGPRPDLGGEFYTCKDLKSHIASVLRLPEYKIRLIHETRELNPLEEPPSSVTCVMITEVTLQNLMEQFPDLATDVRREDILNTKHYTTEVRYNGKTFVILFEINAGTDIPRYEITKTLNPEEFEQILLKAGVVDFTQKGLQFRTNITPILPKARPGFISNLITLVAEGAEKIEKSRKSYVRNILKKWFNNNKGRVHFTYFGFRIEADNDFIVKVSCRGSAPETPVTFQEFFERLSEPIRPFPEGRISICKGDHKVLTFPFFERRELDEEMPTNRRFADFLLSLLPICGIPDIRPSNIADRLETFAHIAQNVLPNMHKIFDESMLDHE